MNWRKAPEEVAAKFDAALPNDPLVQKRKMFGYPAAFVNGNMFAGVHQENIVLRLPPDKREQLLGEPGAQQFELMAGRPMREYIVVPDSFLGNASTLGAWLEESFRFVGSLPVKEPKPQREKAG